MLSQVIAPKQNYVNYTTWFLCQLHYFTLLPGSAGGLLQPESADSRPGRNLDTRLGRRLNAYFIKERLIIWLAAEETFY